MTGKEASVVNYLIGLTGMIFALVSVNKKYREQPGLKILGISAKTFSLITLTGIGIFAALLIGSIIQLFK